MKKNIMPVWLPLAALKHGFLNAHKLSFAMISLVALLQRTPVLRLLFSSGLDGAGINPAQVLRCTVGMAASLGAVQATAGATTFVQNPTGTITGKVGQPLSMNFTITDAPSAVKSWKITGSLPPGLGIAGQVGNYVNLETPVVSGTPTTAGTFSFSVTAYDKVGAVGKTDGVLYPIDFNIAPSAVVVNAPTITVEPLSVTIATGQALALTANAASTEAASYQWKKDGVNIAGATGTSLIVSTPTAGSYTFVATNSGGSTTSSVALVSLVSTKTGLLNNMSVRAVAQPNKAITLGFVVGGSTAVTVLIRAGGPGLAQFIGTNGVMADPQLSIYNTTTGAAVKIATNDSWDSSLNTYFNKTAAYPYTIGSKDAAILLSLPPGLYTAEASDITNTALEALVEVYLVP